MRGIERFIPELLQGEGDALRNFREFASFASRHIAKAGAQVSPPDFEVLLDSIGGAAADAHPDPINGRFVALDQ
jgi:hypothetical protein